MRHTSAPHEHKSRNDDVVNSVIAQAKCTKLVGLQWAAAMHGLQRVLMLLHWHLFQQ
jgi:hypothetical protein